MIIGAATPEVRGEHEGARAERRADVYRREAMIDSILRLLWPKASAEPKPPSPEGENESEMERRWRWRFVCVCVRQHLCPGVCTRGKPAFQEAGGKKVLISIFFPYSSNKAFKALSPQRSIQRKIYA